MTNNKPNLQNIPIRTEEGKRIRDALKMDKLEPNLRRADIRDWVSEDFWDFVLGKKA